MHDDTDWITLVVPSESELVNLVLSRQEAIRLMATIAVKLDKDGVTVRD